LAWLDSHQLTLATLTQPRLEDWLAANPNAATLPATVHHLDQPPTPGPRPGRATTPRAEPHLFLTERDRTEQLRRCLHDEDVPIEDRVLGVLVLLFGISVNRLAQLTADDVESNTKGVRLRIKLAPARWLFPAPAQPAQPAKATTWPGCVATASPSPPAVTPPAPR
jgi:hypothetical protein